MYTKIFASMFDGTLATRGPWEAVVAFQQLLILSDPTGIVDMMPEAIARRTTIPLDIITKGIAALEQADPDSRDDSESGRRIVRLDDHRSWGWRIVNFTKYRSMRSAEDRREYQRNLMRKRRATTLVSNVSQELAPVSEVSTRSTQYAVKNKHLCSISSNDSDQGFALFWKAYPKKRDKPAAIKAWQKLNPDAETAARILAAVEHAKQSREWLEDGGKFIKHPAGYLKGRRFDDELTAPATSRLATGSAPLEGKLAI